MIWQGEYKPFGYTKTLHSKLICYFCYMPFLTLVSFLQYIDVYLECVKKYIQTLWKICVAESKMIWSLQSLGYVIQLHCAFSDDSVTTTIITTAATNAQTDSAALVVITATATIVTGWTVADTYCHCLLLPLPLL